MNDLEHLHEDWQAYGAAVAVEHGQSAHVDITPELEILDAAAQDFVDKMSEVTGFSAVLHPELGTHNRNQFFFELNEWKTAVDGLKTVRTKGQVGVDASGLDAEFNERSN